MKRSWTVLALLILTAACSAQLRPNLSGARAPASLGEDGGYANAEENQFYTLLNQFRLELRLPVLAVDGRLNESARKHSEWMMGMNYLTHVGPTLTGSSYTRVVAEGVDADTLIGENIARGNYSARETFLQWLYSPGHLLGMISTEYDHIGIARSACTEDHDWSCFWTTDFAQLNEVKPEDQAQEEREISADEVARAAEAVVGPLGERRSEISVDEPAPRSPLQRLRDKLRIPTGE